MSIAAKAPAQQHMRPAPHDHIVLDERGIAWINGTTMKVVELAAEMRAHRVSADELHAWHPYLTLAQIHAALSYYYDHQAEFDADMDRSMAEFERLRTQSPHSPLHEKLAERRDPA